MHGRAAHGSRPADGRDAILRMGRVLARLEALDRALQARPPHPLLGTASLHASVIDGGGELSSYPGRCALQIERRTLPGEPTDIAAREADQSVRARGRGPDFAADVSLVLADRRTRFRRRIRWCGAMLAACAAEGVSTRTAGLSFWTDAAMLAEPARRPCCSGPAGRACTDRRSTCGSMSVEACRTCCVAMARRWWSGSRP